MKKVVYKYELSINETIDLVMPKGAEVLTVQWQREPCLWVLVDKDEVMETRTFCVYGTGWDIPNKNLEYIGTFQTDGGLFVWHVFELNKYKL